MLRIAAHASVLRQCADELHRLQERFMPQGEGYAGVSVHILSNLDIYIVPVFQIGEDIFKSTVLESDAVFCVAWCRLCGCKILQNSGDDTRGS